jgi:hypothetical protein
MRKVTIKQKKEEQWDQSKVLNLSVTINGVGVGLVAD